jgi:prevent-host-death family protein
VRRSIAAFQKGIAMETFTAKDAKNRLGEVLRAALRAPVVITVHGKPSVQVMSVEDARPTPPHTAVNAQEELDAVKHRLSCTVLATFPLAEIKRRSLENIERWRANGVSSGAYDEWAAIIQSVNDLEMIAAMVSLDQKSNQLRQSIPYVGMLPKSVVEQLNEKISS